MQKIILGFINSDNIQIEQLQKVENIDIDKADEMLRISVIKYYDMYNIKKPGKYKGQEEIDKENNEHC